MLTWHQLSCQLRSIVGLQNTKATSSRVGTSSARHQQPDKQSTGPSHTDDKHGKAGSELQLIPSMDLDGVEFITFVGEWWKPKF